MSVLDKVFSIKVDRGGKLGSLQRLGPTVDINVELHPSERDAIRFEGRRPPPPIVGTAIIDTGSSVTVLDLNVMKTLAPTIHGEVPLTGYRDRSPTPAPVFHVRIGFPGSTLPAWDGAIVGAPLATASGSQIVLLGRDFLVRHQFSYNGPGGRITLRTA